jgi:trehalose/maltose transport system substrate-binding protein
MRASPSSGHRARVWQLAGVVALLAPVAAACGGGSSGASQTPANTNQTVVFASAGLGTEEQATQAAANDFQRLHPNIHIKILALSSNSTQFLHQIQQRFIAGSSTPDVIESDVTYPATFAKAGWIAPLDKYGTDLSAFFPGQVKAGQYQGKTYAIPWFINPEGLFYRIDLVPTPPTAPTQLVQEAQAAMQKDPLLKEGLAFPGDKYEGAITAFMCFGGQLNPSDLNTAQNQQALQFEHDTIYSSKIAPQAVTGWKEGDVQEAFTSGQTPFAINYPFVFGAAAKAGSAVPPNEIGFAAFPSSTGSPQAALGGEMLALNAKSSHTAAAWQFVQYLEGAQVQDQRAVSTGDPPALQASYNPTLFSQAPYFQQVDALAKIVVSRPVTPNYPQISTDLQTMISSVLSNMISPNSALSIAAGQIKPTILGH